MVFNCAANVKHFSKGTDIEDINYGGVKNLVALCEKNGAYLVHVSTESVGGLTPGNIPDTLTEQMLFFGQLTDNQYVHSKFLAERHILEHMVHGTLKAKILRAGNLSPRAEDGEFQVNLNANASMGRLKALKMLGASPSDLDAGGTDGILAHRPVGPRYGAAGPDPAGKLRIQRFQQPYHPHGRYLHPPGED